MSRLVLIAAAFAGGCGSSLPAGREPAAAPGRAVESIDWARHGLDDEGCFLVRDLDSGEEWMNDGARCAMARRPNSTFKIPNALIALDLGILTGAGSIMSWDSKAYPAESWWSDAWRHDQPLSEAIRVSAVPHFRRLATLIGAERMQAYIDRLDYGNRDISGGLDQFWLRGKLRITARQQVDLLVSLLRDELAVSRGAQATVRDVLHQRDQDGAAFFGKTGSGALENLAPEAIHDGGAAVGWMVGWVKLPERTLVYAMWIEAASYQAMYDRRAQLVDAVLADLGAPRAGS
jgi:beta-lactamase class D